ncbi:hypothetical protein BV25DRAFT_1917592 [Artomyces pyxidatus]|uniref:Uncharacterized protein n=1 Tax=Artomyces pyxidatus TaxID=48021 RepID=A0ACB8SVK6_9AGAM|nr:hypothetical protein BV25DRAFT_1917592 [Artomyces pyxidatus]
MLSQWLGSPSELFAHTLEISPPVGYSRALTSPHQTALLSRLQLIFPIFRINLMDVADLANLTLRGSNKGVGNQPGHNQAGPRAGADGNDGRGGILAQHVKTCDSLVDGYQNGAVARNDTIGLLLDAAKDVAHAHPELESSQLNDSFIAYLAMLDELPENMEEMEEMPENVGEMEEMPPPLVEMQEDETLEEMDEVEELG